MFAQNNSAHIELISIEEITQYEFLRRENFFVPNQNFSQYSN